MSIPTSIRGDALIDLVRPGLQEVIHKAIAEVHDEAIERLRGRLREDVAKLAVDLTSAISLERQGTDLVITVKFPETKKAT